VFLHKYIYKNQEEEIVEYVKGVSYFSSLSKNNKAQKGILITHPGAR
jgi:hypothetical protein